MGGTVISGKHTGKCQSFLKETTKQNDNRNNNNSFFLINMAEAREIEQSQIPKGNQIRVETLQST